MNQHEFGTWGEQYSAQYLEEKGYLIEGRNIKNKRGEIDLLVRKGNLLVAVEVKSRRSFSYGYPREAVGQRKRRHIREALALYVAERYPQGVDIRFDIVEVVHRQGKTSVNHMEGCKL